ncbi:autotransporter outer membrane beta-barrel domain-containing protein [Limnobaculum parvum]|uniref:Autotransporter outer membrane beta-barrel domain-containing protein n=1 Tax=Limnobaculum parvum TaxID=2172103 RepID=A0A2Y9TX19_9GAMM|nr:autotransporter outer membrane beta-barrel domain-containing protein [Limnobaculum parvum]AWH88257.1 autotransporter outer membrane beta-barrel domain-containing protein [Limnobaculum parvum]
MKFRRNAITESILSVGFLLPFMSFSVLADANVPCGNGATITNTTVFGGAYAVSNNCGNNVTITTSGSKTIFGTGSETNNTNGIYFAMNGPHPAFIFGTDLSVTTSGSSVDAIRTNGTASTNGVYTVIAGDRAIITAKGSNSNGINVAQSPAAGAGYGRVYLGKESNVTVKNGVAVRVNLTSQAPFYNLAYVGDKSNIEAGGTGGNSSNAIGYAVYAGNRDSVSTNGTAKGTNAVAIIGSGSTIKTTGNNAYAVYANKGGVIQLQGTTGATTVSTTGTGADALRAEKKLTSDNNFNALGGRIELTGDITIAPEQADTAYVMHTLGDGSVITSAQTNYYTGTDDKLYDGAGTVVNEAAKVTSLTSGIYHLDGKLYAESGLIDLSMKDDSQFTGTAAVSQYTYKDASNANVTDNLGVINLNIDGANSIWNMTGDSEVTNLTLTNSRLKYSEPAAGGTFTPKILTVDNNFNGNGGTLILNTVLGDDSSDTDKMVVKGDTSGQTDVQINHIGGNGALTNIGIEIITVAGNSAGTFSNSKRIFAGPYNYFVRPGSSITGANPKNWYLISTIEPEPTPDPDPTPDPIPTPGPTPDPTPDPTPNIEPVVVTPFYREEFGSYIANLAAANTMFITRLHDRLGETQYIDALTGEKKVTSMWMRHVGGYNSFHDGSGQLKTTGSRYVMQMGGDLAQWSNDGLDRWLLGVMAGYANNHSHTDSNFYSSKGSVDGYSAGLYGTWYANNEDKTGTYVDTWVLYNWFDNEVSGNNAKTENYKSRGVTASIESGYSFKLGQSENASYWLQPKAQIVWMGVSANDRTDSTGTRIKDDTDSNLMTRLGIRTYANGHSHVDDGKNREFEPFLELNWLHNTDNYAVNIGGLSDSQKGAKDLAEVKLGVEGKWNNNITSWINVGQQFGSDTYRDTQGMVGMKYSF